MAGWNSNDSLGPWSSPADFQAGRVHHHVLNANAFIEGGEQRDAALDHRTGRITHQGTDPLARANASVHLPDDAVITKITSHWEDFDSGGNLNVNFWERGNEAGGTVVVGSDLDSSGSPGEGSSSASNLSLEIDASENNYRFQVVFPKTGNSKMIQLNTIRVKYIR